MRICDLCGKSAGDAKSLDNVIVAILKDCPLTNDTVYTVFEKLKIKPSLVDKKKLLGDVCQECHKTLEVEITKVVNDGVNKIAESLVEIVSKKRQNLTEPVDNSAWFNEVAEGTGFQRVF